MHRPKGGVSGEAVEDRFGGLPVPGNGSSQRSVEIARLAQGLNRVSHGMDAWSSSRASAAPIVSTVRYAFGWTAPSAGDMTTLGAEHDGQTPVAVRRCCALGWRKGERRLAFFFRRGLFKHSWIIAMWVVMILQMIAGAAVLGRAVASNVRALEAAGAAATTTREFAAAEACWLMQPQSPPQ